MSTVKDLDADVSAAVLALTGSAGRLKSDWRDETGERIAGNSRRHRLKIDVIEHSVLGSNAKAYLCQVLVDMLVNVAENMKPPDYVEQNWLDQQTLTNHDFWTALASVMQVQPDTTVQVVESMELDGDVLKYTVGANVILQP